MAGGSVVITSEQAVIASVLLDSKVLRFAMADLVPDDNVADSLALALMGARHLGRPLDGALTRDHLKAMGAPSWPTRIEGNR
ncbi:hypothetical protein IAE22_29375 [Bacillus sp. S34]|nr:hypothetical protein [Bacillus sp. S34]